jgi:hypothetical protein
MVTYVVVERNVSHVGRSERDTLRFLSNLEHLLYESADRLQLIGNTLSLMNCAACGGDSSFCTSKSLPEIRLSATNSRFKKLFIIVKTKMKFMKRSRILRRISRLYFGENR